MGDLTLFEALTGGALDRLSWQHSGEFDQNFSKKSNAPGFARGGGCAVLKLTGTEIEQVDLKPSEIHTKAIQINFTFNARSKS